MKLLGIYIHIPFCIRKCFYCDFNSSMFNRDKEIRQYSQALKKDIKFSRQKFNDFRVKSIYFGGGTPSLLEAEEVFAIIRSIKENFLLIDNAEITLEANPGTVQQKKLITYKEAGINRISLGVQSFKDKYLKILGRMHTNTDTQNSISLLRKNGFNNISIDLMYGLPEQNLADWEDDLERFMAMKLEHISFYDLKIEKGTPFYRIRKSLKIAGVDIQAVMYKLGAKKLQNAGYIHYEVSSFSKNGRQSKHNQIYWKNEEYLGVGAGAYSYLEGIRFKKNKDFRGYIKEAGKGYFKQYSLEKLDMSKRMKEMIALNLRILKGFSLGDLEKRSGIKIEDGNLDELQALKYLGLVRGDGRRYRLSKKGVLFYDTVASRILS